ncbi:MAG: hypothetical protein IPF51_12255 [Dehalococcoidia bacterium]|uniref:hypothetical protein n=1 Tax=Candidatus Amarobacter glycogenicus TaxID=3140699 RepID=UPI003136B0A3|nr:hypothetical protein [Dehalococcoidia bacterium]
MNDDFPILAAVAANPTHPYALLEHLQALGLHVSRSTSTGASRPRRPGMARC